MKPVHVYAHIIESNFYSSKRIALNYGTSLDIILNVYTEFCYHEGEVGTGECTILVFFAHSQSRCMTYTKFEGTNICHTDTILSVVVNIGITNVFHTLTFAGARGSCLNTRP